MANTTRGRVWRELFLVAFIATFLVPWGSATANQAARLGNDVYGWEPLGIIAGSSELRMHSLGEDVWEVWVCDTPAGTVVVTASEAAAALNQAVTPFYRWLSGDAYQPRFTVGGSVREGSGCLTSVSAGVTSAPNGVIVVTDEASNGGSAQSGIWCPYEGLCPDSPQTFPANYRSVTIGAHAVVGPNPRLVTVVHELGHTIHFGHSFSGGGSGTWAEYDNPVDVMSKAGDRTRLMATPALNRYIAGWIGPDRVALADGNGSFAISPIGGGGYQLVVVPNGELGWYTVIDVRVAAGYDSSLEQTGVTVHVLDQRAEACGSALPCFGLSRRVSQWPAAGDSYAHVLSAGDQLQLPNGWTLGVGERVGDSFVVNLSDSIAPLFGGPVLVTGVEASSVALTWPPAAGSGQLVYEVAVDGRAMVTTARTSAVVTGLAPDRSHTIRVAARDERGNRAAADPVVVRTLSARDQWVAHDPASGRWLFRLGEGIERTIYFGVPGDVALFCDWDGDGQDSVGLFRSGEGFVYLRNANTLGFADLDFYYGVPTDRPLCGDWDGDGVDSIGVFRPASGQFFLRNSNSLGVADGAFSFGRPGDVPLAGDWDGDGTDTVAVYRPSDRMVHTPEGSAWTVADGHLAVGDFAGIGRDGIATYAGGVITVQDGAGSQHLVRFGADSMVVLAGWWD